MKSNSLLTKKAGEAFLAANKKETRCVTLPSGLQYKVITEGKGRASKLNTSNG